MTESKEHSHEHKHEEHAHHEHHDNKKKVNYWKIATFVLIILSAYLLGTNSFAFMGKNSVGENAVNFINTNLLDGSTQATLVSVDSESGLYKTTISVQGQVLDVYITKDSKLMFIQPPVELTGASTTNTNTQNNQQRANIELNSDDHVEGDINAPVTIIEYSDFECPFCGKLYSESIGLLRENYIETGKAKLIFRHFPLNNIHPNAQKAAEASECAADQGMFWEYHDMLFENQAALTVSDLKTYAKTLGLDSGEFDSCLDSGEKASRVQTDLISGQEFGVSGTPATFVNGLIISGAVPYATFEQAIDIELNN